ncbi:DUF6233 domain-containing protein [Streptomyces sp. D2-8]|uniref:DUF6233 domain-containing protein n=1 Tax=Streptomyces sp. D2-8 TaxID=2707767 RepID=UPI0020BE59FE|nr:DUF6233 domain-containing protein [Streptomyces sp. D2-8]
MWLARIDNKTAELQRREAEREHGRHVRHASPEWIVQLGIGTGRPPVQVHAGDCYAAGNRRGSALTRATCAHHCFLPSMMS